MRTLTIIVFLMSYLAFYSSAQIDKGTFRLGPEISFNSTNLEVSNSELTSSTLLLDLYGGYYVIENLELGLGIGISSSKSEVGSDERKETGIAIGPNVTYMIALENGFYIPLAGRFAYNSLTLDYGLSETSYNGISFGLGSGLEYILSEKLGVRFSLNYDFGTFEHEDSPQEIDISGFTIGIGANFYLAN